jgi:hypothetical protein
MPGSYPARNGRNVGRLAERALAVDGVDPACDDRDLLSAGAARGT